MREGRGGAYWWDSTVLTCTCTFVTKIGDQSTLALLQNTGESTRGGTFANLLIISLA